MNETTRSVSIGRATWLSDAARPATGTSTWSAGGSSAHPVLRLGGASPGGLALPSADPTPSTMYAPRGVWTDGQRVIACDTGNHRVLIWRTMPDVDGADADVVLGQPDFLSEGPAAGGTDVRRGLYLPTGVTVIDGRLVVCDAWHHRVLAWDGIPEESFAEPTWVLGQGDLDSVEANAGGTPSLSSLYWPFGCAVVDGVFWVADTGNRRVLGWRGAVAARPGQARRHPARPGRRQHARGQPGRGHQRLVVPLAARHRRGRADPVHRGCRRPSRPDLVASSRRRRARRPTASSARTTW